MGARWQGTLLREREAFVLVIDPNLEGFSPAPIVAYEEDVCETIPVQIDDCVAVRIGDGASGIGERCVHAESALDDEGLRGNNVAECSHLEER